MPPRTFFSVTGIYEIRNDVTGERYIGSSRRLGKRLADHKQQLRRGIHENKRLQEAWNATPELFTFSVLLITDTKSIIFYEQLLIDFYKPTYNLAPRANGYGRSQFTETQIREMRRLRREGMKMPAIGKLFGTSKEVIWKIVQRKTYDWISD
jgi:group I intron endonuclease